METNPAKFRISRSGHPDICLWVMPDGDKVWGTEEELRQTCDSPQLVFFKRFSFTKVVRDLDAEDAAIHMTIDRDAEIFVVPQPELPYSWIKDKFSPFIELATDRCGAPFVAGLGMTVIRMVGWISFDALCVSVFALVISFGLALHGPAPTKRITQTRGRRLDDPTT